MESEANLGGTGVCNNVLFIGGGGGGGISQCWKAGNVGVSARH